MTQLVRGAFGPFLSIRDGDGIHVKPWEAWPRDIDAITLCPQGDNVYALQMSNGKYMSATNSGGAGILVGNITRSTILTLTSKTTYYVLCMTDMENQSIIGFNGAADASTEVRAVCAYL